MRDGTFSIELDYAGYGLEPPAVSAELHCYRLNRPESEFLFSKRPAVIICPGGAYENRSSREGEPVALACNGVGFHAFVLQYSVRPMRFPGALLELSRAVAWVREHAGEFGIDERRIAVAGFSSGGHLAASLGVFWKEGFLQRFLDFDSEENRPNALWLSYPVISGREGLVHAGSRLNLLGKYPDERELALFSLEDQVSELTPPTFLWHTAEDTAVPAGNSLAFAQALAAHEIPYELHIYPHGPHGLGLANRLTAQFAGQIDAECQGWFPLAARFLENL